MDTPADALHKETYLGDGLYVSFNGWQFILRAPRPDGDHIVYLEPDVLLALLLAFENFVKATFKKYEKQEGPPNAPSQP